jgi:glycosyltransferase involved in cell wall biosynthesis
MARTLRQALLDEGLRRELRERGLRRAAGFSWQLAAQKTLEVYREAAA